MTLREFAKTAAKERLYNLYVVELTPDVLKKKKFMKENAGHNPKMPPLYVGMSARKPGERFRQHKKGYKANLLAQRYGKRLVPKLFQDHGPMPFEQAKQMEEQLAKRLRRQGYAVWQR